MEAFSIFHQQFPLSTLLIVGFDKPERSSDTYDYDSAAIQFTGSIPYKDVANKIAYSDVTIVNSHIETFSCVIIESLSCGIPVISTKVGVAPEIIIHKSNGILIEKNVQSLLSAMVNMYKNYSFYKSNINLARVRNSFDFPTIGAKINQIYQRVLTR